jgi:hypothetical protein
VSRPLHGICVPHAHPLASRSFRLDEQDLAQPPAQDSGAPGSSTTPSIPALPPIPPPRVSTERPSSTPRPALRLPVSSRGPLGPLGPHVHAWSGQGGRIGPTGHQKPGFIIMCRGGVGWRVRVARTHDSAPVPRPVPRPVPHGDPHDGRRRRCVDAGGRPRPAQDLRAAQRSADADADPGDRYKHGIRVCTW